MSWDTRVLFQIHQHLESRSAYNVMDAVRTYGGPTGQALIVCAIVAILLLRRRLVDALFVAVAVAGVYVLVSPLKTSFASGFPSGHALGAMAVGAAAVVVAWPTRLRWSVAVLAIAFVGLIGISRVYFPAHYPSDVVGGWALGLAWVVAVRLVVDTGVFTVRKALSRGA